MLTYVASRGGDQVGLMTFADRVLTYLPPGPGKSASQRLIRSLFAVHPELVETDYEGAFTSSWARACASAASSSCSPRSSNHNAAQQLLRLARGLLSRATSRSSCCCATPRSRPWSTIEGQSVQALTRPPPLRHRRRRRDPELASAKT
jgi:uncharacterized protein (DUF58 family)